VIHGEDRRGSAGGRPISVGLLGGTLVHEFPVDGSEDSLLALPKPGVGLGRLRHRHHRLRVGLVSWEVAEVAGEGVGGEPEESLQVGKPRGLRCGLAGEPLRDRCLGDAQRRRELALGQAALGSGALECSREVFPLIGRRHVFVLSQAPSHVNRMPDQPISGRFSRADNFMAVRRPLVTYTCPCDLGAARRGSQRAAAGENPP
jgi:hypothetical protein